MVRCIPLDDDAQLACDPDVPPRPILRDGRIRRHTSASLVLPGGAATKATLSSERSWFGNSWMRSMPRRGLVLETTHGDRRGVPEVRAVFIAPRS